MDSVGESSFNSTNSFEGSNNSMSSDEYSDSVHQGLKTFSCKSCDNKSYTTRRALRHHIRIVHEGKRYPCQSCDKIFTQNRSLTIHIKNDYCEGLKQEKSVVHNETIEEKNDAEQDDKDETDTETAKDEKSMNSANTFEDSSN